MLELKHIEKTFNPGTVNELHFFRDFNLTIDDGAFVSVVGSNGSGKTSILNIICGSIDIDSGSVIMNGEDITKKRTLSAREKSDVSFRILPSEPALT